MSDLAPEDRALLDLARGGHEPTQEDRSRVRGALMARVGMGAGIAATTAATSKAAAMTAIWTKVLATIVVGTAVGSAGVVGYRAARPVHVPPVSWSTPSRPAEAIEHLPGMNFPPSASIPVVALPVLDEGVRHDAPAPTVTANHPPPPRESSSLGLPSRPAKDDFGSSREGTPARAVDLDPAAAPAPPPSPTPRVATAPPLSPLVPTTLEAETRLVRRGVRALHSGDGATALALFDEHARLFPSGVLSEERAAERVAALAELRRCDEARVAAADFVREHPNSPLTARVRAACSATSNP